ncbi:MAG: hypothetical protein IT304_01560 [Dehalococcoidia bacterium]|nr:hypothetical protein [Dehalococcoidia bacterium]
MRLGLELCDADILPFAVAYSDRDAARRVLLGVALRFRRHERYGDPCGGRSCRRAGARRLLRSDQ